MKCLCCGREFPNEIFQRTYECPCGIKYSKELIENFDKKEWERIRRKRLFNVKKFHDGSKTLILHSIKNKIVHPLHYKLHNLLVKWGWIDEWDL
jgi:hypothetical protein